MREVSLADPDGVRFVPDRHSGVGVLTVAGSSGRIDVDRARLFAERGAVAESVRWFGGPGQHTGPWEIPLELFLDRTVELARECDRILVCGTSFGAEAALLTGVHSPDVAAVIAFAPSDVVWAGITPDERVTSHWTLEGAPLPFVPFRPDWAPHEDPPSFRGLYDASFTAAPEAAARAAIPAERIRDLLLVAGGDDRVWPSLAQAERLRDRRRRFDLPTALRTDPAAGHRTILPGEPVVHAGRVMARGGTPEADSRLGRTAWAEICRRFL